MKKIWGSLKAKHFISVGVVGLVVKLSIHWVVVFCKNVILKMIVLLKNAVPRVSFVQIGSCGLFGFKYKERMIKNSSNSVKGGVPANKSYVGGGVD